MPVDPRAYWATLFNRRRQHLVIDAGRSACGIDTGEPWVGAFGPRCAKCLRFYEAKSAKGAS